MLASLIMAFKLFTLPDFKQLTQAIEERGKERIKWELSFQESGRVYMDTICVPQGVPDEVKARNQIPAGF